MSFSPRLTTPRSPRLHKLYGKERHSSKGSQCFKGAADTDVAIEISKRIDYIETYRNEFTVSIHIEPLEMF